MFATVVGGAGIIVGAWGMNVGGVPFHNKPWEFVAVLAIAVVVAVLASWPPGKSAGCE